MILGYGLTVCMLVRSMIPPFSEHHDTLRQYLVRARHARGLRQSDVAARLGVHQPFVSKYERGERRLDVIELLQIAEVLDLDVNEVLMQLKRDIHPGAPEDILSRWNLSAKDLTELVDENPSLRGMMLGYVAEQKLRRLWLSGDNIEYIGKSDDHDRENKGDHIIEYRGRRFIVESKSLQTRMVEKDGDVWRGRAQVDASDRRLVTLSGGTQVETTLLTVGEFDILAVNCFAFEHKWNFAFARNSDLPRSTYSRYPQHVREQLLASLVPVSWPPQPPFTADLYEVLDQLSDEREGVQP